MCNKFIFISVLIFYFYLFIGGLWARNINVRVTDFPPIYYQTKAGDWTGLGIETAKALFKEAGCRFYFENIPWARSLELMKSGELDMMMGLSITEERKKFIHFVGPQFDETVVLILHKDIVLDIQTLDDFKKLTGEIGRVRGNYRGEKFETKFITDTKFADKFETSFSEEINIRKMISGRIIGMMEVFYVASYRLKNDPRYKNFRIHPYRIYQNMVYFGFSKKSISKKLLMRLDNAYRKIKIRGTLQKILNRYR